MRRGPAAPSIRWEPELLARVVADELERRSRAGQGARAWRYHQAAEPLYALGLEERAQAFFELDLATAEELALDRPLAEAIARAGWPAGAVAEVLLSPAAKPAEMGADLEPRPKEARVILRVGPSLFAEGRGLAQFLAHELCHIADLLDPGFGYTGDRRLRGAATSEITIRDRYRALWCASIDARLHRARRAPAKLLDERITAVLDAFRLDAGDTASIRSWLERAAPSHARLLAIAVRPPELAVECPEVRAMRIVADRTTCPLCTFPEYPACRDGRELPAAVQAAVRIDAPSWSPADGLCSRCTEIYSQAVSQPGGSAWA
jgi:hypothetical protein